MLFKFHQASWICKHVLFPKFGKVWPVVCLNISSVPCCSLLYFWVNNYTRVRSFYIIPQVHEALFFLFSPLKLCFSEWIISFDPSSVSPILFLPSPFGYWAHPVVLKFPVLCFSVIIFPFILLYCLFLYKKIVLWD